MNSLYITDLYLVLSCWRFSRCVCISTCAGYFICLCVCVCKLWLHNCVGVWVSHICDRKQLARNLKKFLLLSCIFCRAKIPLSKLEGYLTLTLGVRRASFSLASSYLNDYFRAYTIIDFLANRLVLVNMVTYVPHPVRGLSIPTSMGCPEICPSPSPPPPPKKKKQQQNNKSWIMVSFYVFPV